MFAEFIDFQPEVFRFAEFGLNRLELFAEIVFALAFVNDGLRAVLDFILQFMQIEFPREDDGEGIQPPRDGYRL